MIFRRRVGQRKSEECLVKDGDVVLDVVETVFRPRNNNRNRSHSDNRANT